MNNELLEFAAKACEIKLHGWSDGKAYIRAPYCIGEEEWNPLTSSSDCAAMCAKLEIDTIWFGTMVECETVKSAAFAAIYSQFNDRESAWRYAATMVAAKIGGMK